MGLLQLLQGARVQTTCSWALLILRRCVFVETVTDSLTKGVNSGLVVALSLRLLVPDTLVVIFGVEGASVGCQLDSFALSRHLSSRSLR